MSESSDQSLFPRVNPGGDIATAVSSNVTLPGPTLPLSEAASVDSDSAAQPSVATDAVGEPLDGVPRGAVDELSQDPTAESAQIGQSDLPQTVEEANGDNVTPEKIDKPIEYCAMEYERTLPNLTLGRASYVEFRLFPVIRESRLEPLADVG